MPRANHSSGGGGCRVIRDASTEQVATAATRTAEMMIKVTGPRPGTSVRPVISCSRNASGVRTWSILTSWATITLS